MSRFPIIIEGLKIRARLASKIDENRLGNLKVTPYSKVKPIKNHMISLKTAWEVSNDEAVRAKKIEMSAIMSCVTASQ